MADDDFAPPSTRLMNFVSEEQVIYSFLNPRMNIKICFSGALTIIWIVFQLAEARRTRGARVDDGTAQRDRSLYEVSHSFDFSIFY